MVTRREMLCGKIESLRTLVSTLVGFALFGCASNSTTRPTQAEIPIVSIIASRESPPKHRSDLIELYKEFAPARRVIRLVAGGFGDDWAEFWLADAEFVYEIGGQRDVGQVRRTLAAPVAEDTWNRIAKLEIAKWKPSYSPRDIHPEMQIFDGTQWQVRMRIGREEGVSGGDNVFPARAPIGSPTLSVSLEGKVTRTAFDDLMEIFEELRKATEKSNK